MTKKIEATIKGKVVPDEVMFRKFDIDIDKKK